MSRNFDALQAALNRRRQMALAMQQSSMLPIENRHPGANVHALQGVAKLAEALMGGLINRKLDKQQTTLDTERQAARDTQSAALAKALGVDPSMTAGLGSTDPMQTQMAQLLLGETLGRQKEDRTNTRQDVVRQDQQRFDLKLQGLGQDFTAGQNQQNRDLQKSMQNIDPLSSEGQAAQIAIAQAKPNVSTDPYGNRTVERNGKEYIQTYAKNDPQAKTLSEVEKGAVKAPSDPLSAVQSAQMFERISNKYQADAIIRPSLTGQTAKIMADEVIKNPGSATNQLASLYLFVKNLDPDSAVREGEVGLANQTQSYFARFKTSLTRLAEGQVISPEAAKQLAEGTKTLIAAWEQTAKQRTRQYESQADVAGVGKQFKQYLSGFQPQAPKEQAAPAGVPAEVWAVMTPEERALWQN